MGWRLTWIFLIPIPNSIPLFLQVAVILILFIFLPLTLQRLTLFSDYINLVDNCLEKTVWFAHHIHVPQLFPIPQDFSTAHYLFKIYDRIFWICNHLLSEMNWSKIHRIQRHCWVVGPVPTLSIVGPHSLSVERNFNQNVAALPRPLHKGGSQSLRLKADEVLLSLKSSWPVMLYGKGENPCILALVVRVNLLLYQWHSYKHSNERILPSIPMDREINTTPGCPTANSFTSSEFHKI